MVLRKWFVRGFVFTVVACCAAAGSAYQQWTNPAAVREQVLANLKRIFPGADVAVDSARLRLLGGIQVGETRLSRRDDPDRTDLLHIPSAILYHDKEKILDGELALRKVELFRPRFRVYRNKDGSWNLQNIIGPQRLDRQMPTIVIHQGTLLLEDRTTAGNINSLEITDFNTIFINDPLSTISFDGVAQSPLVGKVAIAGTMRRATGELTATIQTKETPLGTKLLQRIAPFCPRNSLQNLEIDGQADFEVRLHRQPSRTPTLHYELACQVRKTKVKHPLLPLPLEDLEAQARIVDGVLTVENAQARANGTRFQARGVVQLPCPDQAFEAHLEIDGLPVSEELVKRLPEKTQEVVRLFRPEGTIGVRASLARREGLWSLLENGSESTITVMPEKASSVFQKFPYPVRDLTGALDILLVSKTTKFHLTGKADGQTITMRGHSRGAGDDLDLAADIQVANVSIDETMIKALPSGPEKIARSFHAQGKFDAVASIRHCPGVPAFENTFQLTFRDCTVAWESFPLPLAHVTGQLEVTSAAWRFRDFHGRHGDGVFLINGGTFAVPGKEKLGVDVAIRGAKVALSPALQDAFEPMPALKKVWTQFAPSGVMDFAATIHRPTDALEDLEVRVDARGMTLQPKFFPYRLDDAAGIVHFQKDRVDIGALSAIHGKTRFVAPTCRVDLKPGGGYRADLPDIDIQEMKIDADLLKAMPESLRAAADVMQLRDSLRVKTQLVVAQTADAGSRPEIYWNARGWLKDASLIAGVPIEGVTGVVACRGQHDGRKIVDLKGNILVDQASAFRQPFKNIHAEFHVDEGAPEVLLAGLSAPLFGGGITGEIRVDFEKSAQFELNLTAAQIDLNKFGQHNLGPKSQMEGEAVGQLFLKGTSAGIASLDGEGSIDVDHGKLYNLPLILDLLKFLGLRWPDRTAFEEVKAQFRIRGPRVSLRKLELQGNAVSLSGKGDFNLDGTDLHVDFYPTWARIEQLLPPALRAVPPAVSKNFLIIEMRGKVTSNADDLKFNKKVMPVLFDPIANIRDRVIGPTIEPRRNEPLTQRLPDLGLKTNDIP